MRAGGSMADLFKQKPPSAPAAPQHAQPTASTAPASTAQNGGWGVSEGNGISQYDNKLARPLPVSHPFSSEVCGISEPCLAKIGVSTRSFVVL